MPKSVPLILSIALLLGAVPAHAQNGGPPIDTGRLEELRSDERSLDTQIAQVRSRLDGMVASYEAARTEFGAAQQRLFAAEQSVREHASELREARERLETRATAIYMGRRLSVLDAMLAAKSIDDFLRVYAYLESVVREDVSAMRSIEIRKAESSQLIDALEDERMRARDTVRKMDSVRSALTAELEAAAELLNEVRGAIERIRTSWVFPVAPPYTYVNDFGAPRVGHTHEGNDIFAPMGTELYACASGVITGVGERGLGGKSLYIRAHSGHTYYYAHLDGWAPGIRDGVEVAAGDVVGYVGDTGNAKGGAPHLHFEMKTPDGVTVNPYETLVAADRGWF